MKHPTDGGYSYPDARHGGWWGLGQAAKVQTLLQRTMAIHSSFLGSVTVSGDEAKAFSQKLSHARGSKAASASAHNGKKLVASFSKRGYVTVKLNKPTGTAHLKKHATK